MNPPLITPEIAGYLRAATIPLRLACLTESGWPVVLSLWYVLHGDQIQCATLNSARVVRHLRREPRCAFEIASDDPPYCGVRGRAVAILDPTQGGEVLQRLVQRYLGSNSGALAQWLLSRADQEMAILLEPTSLSTWDYSQRMEDVPGAQFGKPCP